MADTKYNHKASIPIDSIPKEEIATAIEEWSEGNEHLKQLLWNCYNNGVKTDGCCGDGGFYVDFPFPNSEKLGTLFETMYGIPNTQMQIHIDGGNIFSTPEWDKTYIGCGVSYKIARQYKGSEGIEKIQKIGNDMFDSLNNALTKELAEEKSIDSSILDLIAFLKNKESGISLGIYNDDNKIYSLEIELNGICDRLYDQLNNILIKQGFNKEELDAPHYFWTIESSNLDEFKNKISQISKIIIEELKIEPLTVEEANKIHEIDKENSIYRYVVSNAYAHYMKRTLSEEEYEKWYRRQVKLFELFKEKKRIEEEQRLASTNKNSEDPGTLK